MNSKEKLLKLILCYWSLSSMKVLGTFPETRDQTSSRPNTLSDDADDIQKQLDNEARDRIKFGRPKIVWVLKLPNCLVKPTRENYVTDPFDGQMREVYKVHDDLQWDYKTQQDWKRSFPDCGGRSQSPIDIYPTGLIRAHGARPLKCINFDIPPKFWTLSYDGKKLTMIPKWLTDRIPTITGGAVHARRYKFDSLHIHSPSEHTVGNLVFPLETQSIFISAEYETVEDATKASKSDFQAILAISDLYNFGSHTQFGLQALVESFKNVSSILATLPLSSFTPPLRKYAFYQGSLTYPPCTETVAWFIRASTLNIEREHASEIGGLFANNPSFRSVQRNNDRRIYLFNEHGSDMQ